MDQYVKIKLDHEETKTVKIGRGFRGVCYRICFID
jgi:hypothetical protein